MKRLSIIIPAYNEERTIKELLVKVLAVNLQEMGIEKEILIIDDGSTDATIMKIIEMQKENKKALIKLLYHEKNNGKGSALRTGIQHATGDLILTQDADLEYNPEEYKQLLKPFENKEVMIVYGTRYWPIKDEKQRSLLWKRKYKQSYILAYIGGRILTWMTNLLYHAKTSDEATGYKVFRAEVLKSIPLQCTRFEFCPEVTAKVLKRGYTIVEVPITYNPRTYEEGKKINYKDGVQALWTLLKYRFHD